MNLATYLVSSEEHDLPCCFKEPPGDRSVLQRGDGLSESMPWRLSWLILKSISASENNFCSIINTCMEKIHECIVMHIHTHTHKHVRTHTHTHIHAHTCTHTCTHTHTHTKQAQTCNISLISSWSTPSNTSCIMSGATLKNNRKSSSDQRLIPNDVE